MESNFTEKPSKFYNIHAHGANFGSSFFFKLPKNVVVIMPSTRQSLYSTLITEGVMWQINLLKPDKTLLNIKNRIDTYKKNHEKISRRPLDFKVYDSRTSEDIYIPNLFYDKDTNDAFFSAIVQCPLKIQLEYLKDDDFVLPTSTEVLVNQQNIIHNNNPECKDKTRLAIPRNVGFVKKKKGEIESVTNEDVITKLETYIQDNLGTFKVPEHEHCGNDEDSSNHNYLCGSKFYKKNENITNPIIPLLYPFTKDQSSKTYIIDDKDTYKLIDGPTNLLDIIKNYRKSEDPDTVLYFFSSACNEIVSSSSLNAAELEKAYINIDRDKILINNYLRQQYNLNPSIEKQKNQDICKMRKLNDIDVLEKYIRKNELNIFRLQEIKKDVDISDLKRDTIKIINVEEENDIQNILNKFKLIAVNPDFSINKESPEMLEKIKDLIKDCTIDKINKIIDIIKINNDETFLIKPMVIQLLNEKKQNNIIKQLEELNIRLNTTLDLEKAYIERDTDGMLIDDYMTLQEKFDLKSIEEQEIRDICKNIYDFNNFQNKDELIEYIDKNKLNILRLEQIKDGVDNIHLKNDITEIINFEKENDIQYILDVLLAVNLTVSMNEDLPVMLENIKDLKDLIKDLIKHLIKHCTIDKINKIIDKIKNDETFLIKDIVIQLLNEKKRNNIIEQLKKIDGHYINTAKSDRKQIVLKNIEDVVNNCSKDDIDIIKANITDLNIRTLIFNVVQSKEKEIKEKDTNTDLTLFKFRKIDDTLNRYITENSKLYNDLNTNKNIDEIDFQINPVIINALRMIKEIVDKLDTDEERENMKEKIGNSSLKFKNLILNYIENKETESITKMLIEGKIKNKYLKYKKKYINLKKIIAINK